MFIRVKGTNTRQSMALEGNIFLPFQLNAFCLSTQTHKDEKQLRFPSRATYISKRWNSCLELISEGWLENNFSLGKASPPTISISTKKNILWNPGYRVYWHVENEPRTCSPSKPLVCIGLIRLRFGHLTANGNRGLRLAVSRYPSAFI